MKTYDQIGNTPTHVGKTNITSVSPRRIKKHPHARGEDYRLEVDRRDKKETPPRTWGRQRQVGDVEGVPGNTPTHVGKTKKNGRGRPESQKHPHARGEDSGCGYASAGNGETPPRTWGRRLSMQHSGPLAGNTPTHVGKTGQRPRWSRGR